LLTAQDEVNDSLSVLKEETLANLRTFISWIHQISINVQFTFRQQANLESD